MALRTVARVLLPGVLPLLASEIPAQESPFAPLGLERMAELATGVVAGAVENIESAWNRDRTRIDTRITLRVERVLAGRAGPRVVFRIPGGTVGDTTILVTDVPGFRVGEDVLVFLRGTRGRLPSVLGGLEGKVRLSRSADGNLALPAAVAPSLANLEEMEAFLRAQRRN